VTSSLAEINVVPLVDVMLVLLIIFMITAPMIQRGVDVNIPVSTRSARLRAASVLSIRSPIARITRSSSATRQSAPKRSRSASVENGEPSDKV
jgi:biopolymer transport protein ExbD